MALPVLTESHQSQSRVLSSTILAFLIDILGLALPTAHHLPLLLQSPRCAPTCFTPYSHNNGNFRPPTLIQDISGPDKLRCTFSWPRFVGGIKPQAPLHLKTGTRPLCLLARLRRRAKICSQCDIALVSFHLKVSREL